MLQHSWTAWRVGWYSSANGSPSSSAAVSWCNSCQQFFFVWCYISNKVFVLSVLETFSMLQEKIRCVVERVLCNSYRLQETEQNFNVYGATNRVHTVLQWSTKVSLGSSWNPYHSFQFRIISCFIINPWNRRDPLKLPCILLSTCKET